MNKEEALSKMLAPNARRPSKWRGGVIQIWITRTCDKSCFGCTQGSNLRSSSKENMNMTTKNFLLAVQSLIGYPGVVGVFGGNPALHPEFPEICNILRAYIPYQQRGLWCNNPFGHAAVMRETFNPAYSNLNVHQDQKAYDAFKSGWPECNIIGLESDSRHSPVHGSMLDLQTLPDPKNPKQPITNNEENRWDYISNCDINQHWSALVGQFRGQPRAWFCEIAGSQSMLMQEQPDYPDTGIPLPCPPENPWWRRSMQDYAEQASYHCHRCLVPLRGYGENANSTTGIEQTTKTYLPIYIPKKTTRAVSLVETHSDLLPGRIKLSTNYIGNSNK